MNEKINYNHCILSNSKTYDGEQWVRGEIIVHGGEKITHIIENDTVLSYNRPQIEEASLIVNWEILIGHQTE